MNQPRWVFLSFTHNDTHTYTLASGPAGTKLWVGREVRFFGRQYKKKKVKDKDIGERGKEKKRRWMIANEEDR